MLRIALTMASKAPTTSSTLRPVTRSASLARTRSATAAAPYVQPTPVTPPLEARTTIIVVESHDSVPSASGASVGTEYAATSSSSTTPPRGPLSAISAALIRSCAA